MKLLQFATKVIIASTAISTVICCATNEQDDETRAMEAFHDMFQEHLQSQSAKLHELKEQELVEPPHSVTFSGNGKNVAIGTWQKKQGQMWILHLVEVYRNNGNMWELVKPRCMAPDLSRAMRLESG